MYRQTHPWIADAGLSPKSVVRDMFERAMTFGEFVGFYGLARSEGVVLRYLSDAYKALRQTVPDKANEDLTDLIEWLGEVVRQTDSSLLDEWEELTNPTDRGGRRSGRSRGPRRITLNSGLSGSWSATRCSAASSWSPCTAGPSSASSTPTSGWDAGRWAEAGTAYYAEHDSIGTGPAARGPALFMVEEHPGTGRSSRSSTTPKATTTGASPPPSTWAPPTKPARPS